MNKNNNSINNKKNKNNININCRPVLEALDVLLLLSSALASCLPVLQKPDLTFPGGQQQLWTWKSSIRWKYQYFDCKFTIVTLTCRCTPVYYKCICIKKINPTSYLYLSLVSNCLRILKKIGFSLKMFYNIKNLTGLSDWTRRRGFPGRRSQGTTWKTARRTGWGSCHYK